MVGSTRIDSVSFTPNDNSVLQRVCVDFSFKISKMFQFSSYHLLAILLMNFTTFTSVSSKYGRITAWNTNKYRGELNVICGETSNEQATSSEISFKTIHFYYKTDINAITFENCQFHEIGIDFFEYFTNLLKFDTSNVELQTLRAEHLRNAKKLTTLIASNNRLTEIPAQLFINATQLNFVDLSKNNITHIAPFAFDDANNLKTLNLSHNQITKLHANSFVIPNLITLDLAHNSLATPADHVFDQLINLKHLNLSFNPVGNLDVRTFAHLNILEMLSLQHTNISSIQLGTFAHQHHLIALDLSENNLFEFNFNLFFPIFRQLQTLKLNRNRITTLSAFSNKMLPQLTLLDINRNKFNCEYLQNFMATVNWEKLHLHIDASPINGVVQTSNEENIHGVYCISNSSRNTLDVNSSAEAHQRNMGIHFTQIIERLQNSTEILLQSIEKLQEDSYFLQLSLVIVCICVIISIVLLVFLKYCRLCSCVNCRETNYRYDTLFNKGSRVKYRNGQIRLE